MRSLLLLVLFIQPGLIAMAAEPAFAPNQEWTYRARALDPGSTIIIGLIEDGSPIGRVIHIAVRNVNVKNPRARGGVLHQIGHLPMSEDALRASVTELIGLVDPPQSVLAGVKEWRAAEGGVFTISVAETVDYAELALSDASPRSN